MSIFDYVNQSNKLENNSGTSDPENGNTSIDEANKIKSFFYNAPIAIATFTSSGYITDFNDNFTALFGVDPITILSFNLFSIEDKYLLAAIKKVLQGENAHYEGFYKLVTTGKTIPIKGFLSPIVKENVIVGGVVIIEDISFRKQLERLFFHDILNSCGNIRNLSEILIDSRIAQELKDRIISQINTQSNKMLDDIKIYKHLMAYGQSELKAGYKEMHSVDYLGSCVTRFANPDILDGQLVEINEDSMDFAFFSDQLLLDKIFEQLIKNALAATQSGELITLYCNKKEKEYHFSVKNPAIIPPLIQPLIFTQHIYKTESEKGMGTYCIKHLAERFLNGSITFTSEIGKGTEFTLILPGK